MVDPAARSDELDHVFGAGADDVGDDRPDRRVRGADPLGAPDALLQAVGDRRDVEVDVAGGDLEVVALVSDLAEAEDRVLTSGEAALELLEFRCVDAAVRDVRLDAVAFPQGAGELAQAPHPLGEHEHLLLG